MIDIEAIRQRNEKRHAYEREDCARHSGRLSPADADAYDDGCDYEDVRLDVDALLAEVERLRHIVRATNPCPHCRTLHLVRRPENAPPDEETSGAELKAPL